MRQRHEFTYCDFCGGQFAELLPILQCFGAASLSAIGYICSRCRQKLEWLKEEKEWGRAKQLDISATSPC